MAQALAGAGNCYELRRQKGRAVAFWRQALDLLQRAGLGNSAGAHQLENTIQSYQRYPLVFISYAHRDARQVVALERYLLRGDCRVMRDARDFRAGDSVQDEIARTIDECPNYVIIWSRHYRERTYTQFELEIIRRLTDPASPERQLGRRAIVVGIDREPLPEALQNILMIQRAGRRLADVAGDVLHALTGQRGRL